MDQDRLKDTPSNEVCQFRKSGTSPPDKSSILLWILKPTPYSDSFVSLNWRVKDLSLSQVQADG